MGKQGTAAIAAELAKEPDPIKRNEIARKFIESFHRLDDGPAPPERTGFVIGGQSNRGAQDD